MPLKCPLTAAELEKVAQEHGTPFQLYDEGLIRANARGLLEAFSAHFAGFQQFFAVKALPNPAVLRVLLDEGCGLDCSSVSELHIAKQLGVPGHMVMYTSNFTACEDLAYAFDMGAIMNLDDISLVQSIVDVRGRCPDLISFRLNPGLGRTDSETKSNVLGGPDAKFGVPPDQILEGYRRAKAHGATRFGIHMMTGSCVMSDAYWEETVGEMFETIGRVRQELGIEFEFVNVGGGLGIPYRPEEPRVDPAVTAARMRAVVDARVKAMEPRLPSEPRLMMENGRYMTGPFGWLVTRCKAQKRSFEQTYYGVDACMANLMRPGMYGSYHHITVPAREDGVAGGSTAILPSDVAATGATAPPAHDMESKAKAVKAAEPTDSVLSAAAKTAAKDEAPASTAAGTSFETRSAGAGGSAAGRGLRHVVGTLCENNDWFAKSRDLPAAEIGDLFVIHDTGAHSHSMGFQYNGKLRAPELLVRGKGDGSAAFAASKEKVVALIRRRETIESLYLHCVVPEDLHPPP